LISWLLVHLTANWVTLAASSDGTICFGSSNDNVNYWTRDSGFRWTSLGGQSSAIATTIDGQIAFSVNYPFGIYKFSGGSAFTRIDPNDRHYSGIACDATCNTIVTITFDQGVYMSTNSGSSFSATTLNAHTFRGVALSANGSVIYCASIQASNTFNRGIVYSCRFTLQCHNPSYALASPPSSCPAYLNDKQQYCVVLLILLLIRLLLLIS